MSINQARAIGVNSLSLFVQEGLKQSMDFKQNKPSQNNIALQRVDIVVLSLWKAQTKIELSVNSTLDIPFGLCALVALRFVKRNTENLSQFFLRKLLPVDDSTARCCLSTF